jgi:hypothetical protein
MSEGTGGRVAARMMAATAASMRARMRGAGTRQSLGMHDHVGIRPQL